MASVIMMDRLSGNSTAATNNRYGVYDEGNVLHEIEEVLGDVSGAAVDLLFSFIWRSAGFWSRVKEKGSVAKDAWGVIGSAFVLHLYCHFYMLTGYVNRLGVQSLMSEMERLQAKGEIDEEGLRALEQDVTGKVRVLWQFLYRIGGKLTRTRLC